ncbi:MAG: hypothetical protein CENE_01590 [Candidatus Celerinatantimonas neptuna]|nr:MAG: hypothetical protein CENE_01590 [Candidatus Celerinatantimonas neptuna]
MYFSKYENHSLCSDPIALDTELSELQSPSEVNLSNRTKRAVHTAEFKMGSTPFIFATIGINIVANFVSPASDFSNVAPQKISFKRGGFIAAFGSLLITPWNLFNNPDMIHYTVDFLAALIGPLYGIILVDYFKIKNQQIDISALYSELPTDRYWYQNGINRIAIQALLISAIVSILTTFVFSALNSYALFISGATAALSYQGHVNIWLFLSIYSVIMNRIRCSVHAFYQCKITTIKSVPY